MASFQTPRADWAVRKFASAAEADAADAEFWRQIPPDERVLLAWRLSLEQYQLAGLISDEPTFSRSTVRITRR